MTIPFLPDHGPSLGITFVPALPPERLVGLATKADDAGLDLLWVWEDCFKETGTTSAAVALASTSRIPVAIALLPVPLRNAALTAMEFATLERLFPGRLLAGVGHGVQDWMGQVGARAKSPLTLLREYASAVRSLLDGERVSTDGDYVRLDGVALDWPPTPAPPLWVGGTGPKSVRLAAELGDGLLLGGGTTDQQTADAVAIAHEVRGQDFPVATNLMVTTGPDARALLDRELGVWGLPTDQGIGVAGGAAEIADAVGRLTAVGITHVAIQPVADEPDLDGLVELLADEVLPLVRTP